MATETVQMDDKALFDAATATDAPAEVTTQQAEPQQEAAPEAAATQDQPRDEHGRFAPKTAEEQQAETQQAQEQQPQAEQQPSQSQVPAWRLSEIAAERREAQARADAAERRAQELEAQNRQFQTQLRQFTEKPQTPPDIFEDASAAIRHTMAPEVTEMRQALLYNSRLIAQQVHGAEKVTAADDAFSRAVQSGQIDPAEYQRVIRSPNVYDAAVRWHGQQQALTALGDKDPKTWAMSQLGEWAKDPNEKAAILAALGVAPAQQQQQPNQPGQNNIVKLPPSLSRATGAQAQEAGTMSNEDLYAYATR